MERLGVSGSDTEREQADPPDGRPPGLRRALWLAAAIILAAAWIDVSPFHESVHPDSLIPILSSLYAWEPFAWEQSRMGLLVPLVASPISNPWHNYLFQNLVAIGCGLALLVFLVRYIYDGPAWRQISLASVAAFVVTAPVSTQYQMLSTGLPYGPSLLLGLAALLTIRSGDRFPRRSLLAALVISIVAHWLNGSVALVLVPLVVTRAALDAGSGERAGSGESAPAEARRPISEALTGSLVLGAGFAIGQLMASASLYPLVHLQVLHPSRWPEAWTQMALSVWKEAQGPFATTILLSSALGVGIAIRERRRGRPAWALRLALPLCLAATAYGLLIGASEWVEINSYHPRYALPAVICLHTAAMIALLVPAGGWLRSRRYPLRSLAASALLVASLAWSYGAPSPSLAREVVDRRLGTLSEDVRTAAATHVLGTYGTVWETVFHTNMLRYEEGRQEQPLWGVAFRAWPTEEQWRAVPLEQWRVVVRSGDRRWEQIARRYRLPELTEVGRAGALRIFRPSEVVGPVESRDSPRLIQDVIDGFVGHDLRRTTASSPWSIR